MFMDNAFWVRTSPKGEVRMYICAEVATSGHGMHYWKHFDHI